MLFLCLSPNWVDLSHLANVPDMKNFKQVKNDTVTTTFEMEKLAVSVKRFCCLYEESCSDYKDKNKKANAWREGSAWQWRLNLILASRSVLVVTVKFLHDIVQ